MTNKLPERIWNIRSVVWLLMLQAAALICIADRAPMHIDNRFPEAHLTKDFDIFLYGVVDHTLPGPFVYRILVPYTVHGIHQVIPALSEISIDLVLKFIALLLCQALVYRLLRRFMTEQWSLAGILLLDLLMAFSLTYIQGPSVVETTDLLNLAAFTGGLIFLQDRRYIPFTILACASLLNRETLMMFIPLILLLEYRAKQRSLAPLLPLIAMPVVFLTIKLAVRSVATNGGAPGPAGGFGWFNLEGLPLNIPFYAPGNLVNVIAGNVHVAMLLGPLIILSIIGLRRRDRFIRDAFMLVPLFVLVHYALGSIIEGRLWMPVYPLLLTPSLLTMAEYLAPNVQSQTAREHS